MESDSCLSIENQNGGYAPANQARQQGAIGEQHVLGRSSPVATMDKEQIAEQTIQDEGDGQHHRMIFGERLGGERVERVRHNRCRCGNHDEVVKQFCGVLVKVPAMGTRVLL